MTTQLTQNNQSKMFTKILIANRGEIACRIIKTAKKMGILTVAVYSDADENALHVKMADEAVYIGKSPSRESYLLSEKVIEAAVKTDAQAIHPGYGFLSENSDFCRLCDQNNITFIGPPIGAIEAMGSKSAAKNIMQAANVPLVPGYHGDDQSEAVIKGAADKMGYPVLLKATAGGGGKGMRQIWSAEEFTEGFEAVKREALSSFGDDTMLVEKYLTQPRHVEIQVFCDNYGNAVYLFERDCSVQRRHQKVVEEAPAFAMTEALRDQMGQAAIKSAQAIGYQGAGTVEFLLDFDGSFYFMEMNTRLQVEHPVTEFITKQDLVEWQLRVAAGETLPKAQDQLSIHGHAFEARIYAEDADNDFLPDTGTLTFMQTPEESEFVRIDTGVCQGDEVSVFYDPMIAKLIVWGENREKALQRLTKALTEYHVGGVKTNLEFLSKLVTSKAFIDEDIDTGFIEKHHDAIFNRKTNELLSNQGAIEIAKSALLVLLLQNQSKVSPTDPTSPWNNTNSWQLNDKCTHKLTLEHNATEYNIEIEEIAGANNTHPNKVNYLISVNNTIFSCYGVVDKNQLTTTINGIKSSVSATLENNTITLYTQQGAVVINNIQANLGDHGDDENHGGLLAPMNGTMVSILVKPGDTVTKNQPLVIMEAMKMEHTIRAPADGVIDNIFYAEGDMVDGGSELLAFSIIEENNGES